MVFDRALGLDIQIAHGLVAERFEKMKEHLCRHLADHFALEFRIPDDPVPSAEIDRDLSQTVIHRQTKPVSLHSSFLPSASRKRFAESDRDVLDRVVLVDVQIAFCRS